MATGRCGVRWRAKSYRHGTYEEDIRVLSRSLVGRGTVKVPFLELGDGSGLSLLDGHGLATHASITVNPDVWGISAVWRFAVFDVVGKCRDVLRELVRGFGCADLVRGFRARIWASRVTGRIVT